jgi:hypothetical protein
MRTPMAFGGLVVCLGLAGAQTALAGPTFPSSAPGRYVAMVSPTNGETFVTPLQDLRLVAAGYDINIYTNVPTDGHGQNATSVDFYVDDTLVLHQDGLDAEYSIFKGMVKNLNLSVGQHLVWARATYTNVHPTLFLDSPPFTITVQNPPAYAQTVSLAGDVQLSGSQSYELVGTETGRIRLDGNGHRIITSNGGSTSGKLTLKFVDVYNLGSDTNATVAGIDVTTTGTVTIEDSVFDSTNGLALDLNGSASASIRHNLFRSNMRMPVGQYPDGPSTVPVLFIGGSSAAAKTFAGNNVGAAPVHFENAKNWTIGGSSDRDTNVLIGPRTAFEIINSANMTVRGNFVHHNYYGGWSQGQLLEVHGSKPLLVEHNVLYDSSWPVRGIADVLRYNLILEAGHQWLVPDSNALIHHNIFVGGDNDTGGITGYYNITNVRIENNTFDLQNGGIVHTAINWQMGATTLRSNAFINVPSGASAVVDKSGGTIDADYNGFFNQEPKNYIDSSGATPVTLPAPPHDVSGANPKFAGPLPTVPFDQDEPSVWKRQLAVSQILAIYRARYKPITGSPYIDAGDQVGGGAGNDIGAVGAGTANDFDKFGTFGDGITVPPPGDPPGAPGGTPDPSLTRYFAEGSNSTFFQTTIDLVNPGTQNASVTLRFLRSDGTVVPQSLSVPAQRHATVATASINGLQSADFSTVIETDQPIVAERTMVWPPDQRYGSHSETAVKAPATQWFLAEGATHGVFSLFYLLANPSDTQANVEIRYLLPGGQMPIVITYPVAPHSRRTIPVDGEPGLAATDVSAAIRSTNDVPIIAERAMYFSRPGQDFAGGHDSAGVTQPSGHWFFAEGATGSFFDMFLLLANPDPSQTAHVTVSYLLTDGTVIPVHHDLAPNSRETYNVALEEPRLASAAMSTVVDSAVPIVAERSMYWPKDWTEAHNSPGATETGTRWAVAGGEEGGTFGAQTYVLIANTSSFAGTARVTVLQETGAPLTKDIALAPSSRTNVAIGSTTEFGAVVGSRFGVVIESLGTTPAQIVVERATYSNDAAGTVWAAGASALATRLQ